MDKKIIAVAVVAVILVAAVGVYFMTQKDKDDDLNIVGRVNTDGSGIILKAGEKAEDYVTIVNEEPTSGAYLGGNGTWVVFKTETWGGKVFTDPGAATIQHVQLNTIANTMGLKFVQYTVDTKVSDDTLYYVPGVGTYAAFESTLETTPAIVGGIFWEPQSSVATMDGCSMMAVTNQIFPGHTCCTIGAQHSYLVSHEDETIRFLAAYIESVNLMTSAIADKTSTAYQEVLNIAVDNVSMPSDMSKEDKVKAIESAFGYVVYKYADSKTVTDDPLADLKKDIASMAEEFVASSTVKNDAKALGFDSYEAMAEQFVQSQYIKQAMTYQKFDSYDKTATITVAVIGGDVHQLAIHYGMALGIFAEYGIDVKISSQTNGPGVFTSLHNGEAQFGFIGAPPMTINSMNSKLI